MLLRICKIDASKAYLRQIEVYCNLSKVCKKTSSIFCVPVLQNWPLDGSTNFLGRLNFSEYNYFCSLTR